MVLGINSGFGQIPFSSEQSVKLPCLNYTSTSLITIKISNPSNNLFVLFIETAVVFLKTIKKIIRFSFIAYLCFYYTYVFFCLFLLAFVFLVSFLHLQETCFRSGHGLLLNARVNHLPCTHLSHKYILHALT